MGPKTHRNWSVLHKKFASIDAFVSRSFHRGTAFADHVSCRAKSVLLSSFEQHKPFELLRTDLLVFNAARVEQLRRCKDIDGHLEGISAGPGFELVNRIDGTFFSETSLKTLTRLLKSLGVNRASVAEWCDVSPGFVSRAASKEDNGSASITEIRFKIQKLLATRMILRFGEHHLDWIPRHAESGPRYVSLADCEQMVRVVQSRIDGYGVRALAKFECGDVIGGIRGEIIHGRYDSTTCFELADDTRLEPSQPFKFLNHKCEPNADFFVQWENWAKQAGSSIVWLEALRPIAVGDEITINYRWPVGHKHGKCNCGAINCSTKIGVSPDEM